MSAVTATESYVSLDAGFTRPSTEETLVLPPPPTEVQEQAPSQPTVAHVPPPPEGAEVVVEKEVLVERAVIPIVEGKQPDKAPPAGTEQFVVEADPAAETAPEPMAVAATETDDTAMVEPMSERVDGAPAKPVSEPEAEQTEHAAAVDSAATTIVREKSAADSTIEELPTKVAVESTVLAEERAAAEVLSERDEDDIVITIPG